jgi:hypothetical protein
MEPESINYTMPTNGPHVLFTTIKYAGYWCIGSGFYTYHIAMVAKPKAVHRFFMKLLLGITWKDGAL